MIIIGDIASPDCKSSKQISKFIKENPEEFSSDTILFNLEGLITDSHDLNDNSPILFNHTSILNSFTTYKTKIAALANNHTLDLPHLLHSTKESLSNRGFNCVGAGKESDFNFNVIEVFEDNYQVFIINACWDFLLYHQNNMKSNFKVNIIDEFKILKLVNELKLKYPNSRIITYFHWSFDLEILPSPSYRIFAKDLIDSGVSLVVGCHSHCVQGGEKYKEGYIIYGLGNFFLPSGIYAKGKLKFPKMSDLGWVLKWDIKSNSLKNTWIDTSSNSLNLLNQEDFENSPTMEKYSQFSGLSDNAYVEYFKKYRRKNKFNPIFYDYKNSLSNNLKMKVLKIRAKLARMAARLNLINWQN